MPNIRQECFSTFLFHYIIDNRFYQLQNGKLSFSLLSLTWSGRQERELAEKEDFSEGKYFVIQDGIFFSLSPSDINKNQIVLLYYTQFMFVYDKILLNIQNESFKMIGIKSLSQKLFLKVLFYKNESLDKVCVSQVAVQLILLENCTPREYDYEIMRQMTPKYYSGF